MHLFQYSEGDDTLYKDGNIFSSSSINESPFSFLFPSFPDANGRTSTLHLETENNLI